MLSIFKDKSSVRDESPGYVTCWHIMSCPVLLHDVPVILTRLGGYLWQSSLICGIFIDSQSRIGLKEGCYIVTNISLVNTVLAKIDNNVIVCNFLSSLVPSHQECSRHWTLHSAADLFSWTCPRFKSRNNRMLYSQSVIKSLVNDVTSTQVLSTWF